MKLYNTLTRKKEDFFPLKNGVVKMYNCGPTVYYHSHIGNMRAYIFADTLRKVLEYNGYKVKQVINITDVGHLTSDSDEGEDKMTKALKRENKSLTLESMRQVANFYYTSFLEDLKKLNIKKPFKTPFASDHINEITKLIEKIIKKEAAYITDTGIYFNTSKIKDYGKLGGLEQQENFSRIKNDLGKKNNRDFVLWKFSKEIGFNSILGKGFPGWHIECSAMAMKYLGETLDIHTGGIDHIAIHHNNEIAQSETATGKPFSRFWLHNNMINFAGKKMAKSAGGIVTLKDLNKKGFNPQSYRYLVLTAHYRSTLEFSFESLKAAESALEKLSNFINKTKEKGNIIEKYKKEFSKLIDNDLDTPKAIALIWKLVKDKKETDEDKKATILNFNKVLGLNFKKANKQYLPNNILELAKEREEARKEKNWVKADKLRTEIEKKGFVIKDQEKTFKIIKK